MEFTDRNKELAKLREITSSGKATLSIVFGRRRCGKSRLIKEFLNESDIYFMADQSETSRQIELFAKQISYLLPGFDQLVFPNWEVLFENLNYRTTKRITICIDEFPYLVKNAPELPSILQKIWENKAAQKYHLILCGSSQQLMQGLVLNASAPLYGRADGILKIKPMAPPYLQEILQINAADTITEYSVWGGIPRYWELRLKEKDLWQTLNNHVFTSQGILFDEPVHLFLDDMRDTVHSFTLLSLIASGSHRLSEIAARIGKPATHLSAPLNKLLMLGYIEREMPYGENLKNSKKSLYKISDPFLNFYFTFVVPNRSLIEIEQTEVIISLIKEKFNLYVSNYWEKLCRQVVPLMKFGDIRFKTASRWWGSPQKDSAFELDIVAASLDETHILVGECKWSDKKWNTNELIVNLLEKAALLSFTKGKTIIPVLFLKNKTTIANQAIFFPEDVLRFMK